MIETRDAEERTGRLLVVCDLARLGPVVAEAFAPMRIDGVHSYLEGVAEVRRSRTRAVLAGHDRQCRRIEPAFRALKSAAGEAPIIFCCDPAYEDVGQRLLGHGADDYLVFPPEPGELEERLRIVSRATRQSWLAAPIVAPTPSAEELARLADLLPRIEAADPHVPDLMAELVRCALQSEWVTLVLGPRVGSAGGDHRPTDSPVLIEPIAGQGTEAGQIRVGPRTSGKGYTHEDTAKLRHYGVLLARLAQSSAQVDQWRQLALTDDLTGLPNRRRLLEFLEEKLGLAQRLRTTVTALVFDIDDFKRYNDQYGHDAGDQILRETGQLFVSCCRRTDMVARYGGDEFVVVFWDPEGPRTLGSQHPQGVIDVLERFRAALKVHTFSRLGPEATGQLTISAGLAHYPWQARGGLELIEAADRALLQAKRGGKNRFWVVGQDEAG